MKLPIEVPRCRWLKALSRFAPIEIHALSFGIWIFCRGEFSTRQRNHERIHFQQQLELAFALQWVLYIVFHLVLLVRYRGNGRAAYRNNYFELEAYDHDVCPYYLEERKRYAWVKYIFKK